MIKNQNDDEVTLRLVTLGSQHYPSTEGQRESGWGHLEEPGATVGLSVGSWTQRRCRCFSPPQVEWEGTNTLAFLFSFSNLLPMSSTGQLSEKPAVCRIICSHGQPDCAAEQSTGRVKSGCERRGRGLLLRWLLEALPRPQIIGPSAKRACPGEVDCPEFE